MSSRSSTTSPTHAVVALPRTEPDWQPVLHVSNQVVLYNPTSHALAIRPSANVPDRLRPPCPYCKQALPPDFDPEPDMDGEFVRDLDPAYHSRASDYFRLLETANENASRPESPISWADEESSKAFAAEKMAEGYFKAFFQEEYKLGMGANGSVYLCQHILDGNPLGHFAVKKIAVGESHSYLLKILREVRLLERLHHPNIITYHHAWLETCQFSPFGPKVPTLHVLMQWAEGGSLDDFISTRLGRAAQHIHMDPLARFSYTPPVSRIDPASTIPSETLDDAPVADPLSRSARIKAFRAFQRASPEEKARLRREMEGRTRTWTPVHLLSADEIKSLFNDVVQGLTFLHQKSILHLDLKPGNVLLTWDEGKLVPRAMLSDFGTSRDMLHGSRTRSGNTGTLEYASPESLPSPVTGLLQQVDSKADMWSLGMILHKLLFFNLPYRYASAQDANGEPVSTDREGDKLDRLEQEVLRYPGFKSAPAMVTSFEARRLPRSYLMLLEGLLNVTPSGRPSIERVVAALSEGMLNPLREDFVYTRDKSSLIPLTHRRPDSISINPTPPLPSATVSSVPSTPGPFSERGDAGESTSRRAPPSSPKTLQLSGQQSPSSNSSHMGKLRLKLPSRSRQSSPSLGCLRKEVVKTALKSCILVAKVLSATSLCSLENEGWIWRMFVLFVVLSAAVLDTVIDSVWTSTSLAVFHLAVVFGCSRRIC